ncbi:hypothetical protein HDV00_008873 [Rhizophlyctis rosea]|nr:hypothetical protein HDV00_008873 [Rhizophlyctis rosea]
MESVNTVEQPPPPTNYLLKSPPEVLDIVFSTYIRAYLLNNVATRDLLRLLLVDKFISKGFVKKLRKDVAQAQFNSCMRVLRHGFKTGYLRHTGQSLLFTLTDEHRLFKNPLFDPQRTLHLLYLAVYDEQGSDMQNLLQEILPR